jgi:hypothetical protein
MECKYQKGDLVIYIGTNSPWLKNKMGIVEREYRENYDNMLVVLFDTKTNKPNHVYRDNVRLVDDFAVDL